MELGATVCTPQAPACDACPLAELCKARAHGTQRDIPAPKPKAKQSELFASTVLVRDQAGRLLVERRPDTGLWAGLWQAPTLERPARHAAAKTLAETLGVEAPKKVHEFTHQTTHRLVRFRVWEAGSAEPRPGRVFRSEDEIAALALSNPQRRVLLGP